MSRSCFYSSLFLLLRFYTAQSRDLDDSEERRGLTPATTIVLIIFVTLFFALGCLSVYMRTCLLQALGIDERFNDLGNVRQTVNGLDVSVIETFPMFRYSSVKTLSIGKEALECPVCLNEFKEDETLRLIPLCCHVFHCCCIDAWLRSQTTCPLCRANLVPVPGVTVSFEIPGLAVDDNRRIVPGESGNQSMPKSMVTGCKLDGLLNQTGSTGQTGENLDRFTLLPQEIIHDQLVYSSLGNQGGHVALPQVRSSIQGYRTGN